MVLIVLIISICCTCVFLLDVSASRKRIKTKNKSWENFTNESSEKYKIETGMNIWKSLSVSNENKEEDK
jgi:hypothetical protein